MERKNSNKIASNHNEGGISWRKGEKKLEGMKRAIK